MVVQGVVDVVAFGGGVVGEAEDFFEGLADVGREPDVGDEGVDEGVFAVGEEGGGADVGGDALDSDYQVSGRVGAEGE